MSRRHLIDVAVIVVLAGSNLLLLARHLTCDFPAAVWNNDYILIAMSRMYQQQPWSWNNLWYCGFPTSYVYPPVFHALVLLIPFGSLGRAYHLVSGLCYVAVPISLYLLALCLFRSRLAAILAAVGYSILPSPIYSLPTWWNLAAGFHYAPWPFVTLVGHGEAPHTLSLAIIPLCVAAAWQCRWVLAAICAGVVFLTNWPGMVGMVMILVAVAVAQTRTLGLRLSAKGLAATVGIGYGLAAFWVTPGFLYVTSLRARTVLVHGQEHFSAPWTLTTYVIILVGATVATLALYRRIPPVPSFLMAWLAISGTPVVAFTLVGNHLIPMPWRYAMEFNMALALTFSGLACLPTRWRFAIPVAALVLGVFTVPRFIRSAWQMQPTNANLSQLPSYKIAEWLDQNTRGSRVFIAGELSGAINAWNNTAQVLGGHQGVSNLVTEAAHKEVIQGCGKAEQTSELALLWLRALNSPYLVVHAADSSERFHWFVQSKTFPDLPVAWNNGAGDIVYQLPPPELHDAVVVDKNELRQLPALRATNDLDGLRAYVTWASGKRPARLQWIRSDHAEIEAELGSDEALLVKISYDGGWRVPHAHIRRDPIGFVLIDMPAGHHTIDLSFHARWDVWLGRVVTLATVMCLLARAPTVIAGLIGMVPPALGFLLLATGGSPDARLAAEAFQRIRPPLIMPGGIVDGTTNTQPPLKRGGIVSIYGRNFGGRNDSVRVWIGDREAKVLYRDPLQLNARLPDNAPRAAEISVEVNGCQGNSFLVPVRD